MHTAIKFPLYLLAIGTALASTATVGFALWWISINFHPLWTILASITLTVVAYNLLDWHWASLDAWHLEPIRRDIQKIKLDTYEKQQKKQKNHADFKQGQQTLTTLTNEREELERKQQRLSEIYDMIQNANEIAHKPASGAKS